MAQCKFCEALVSDNPYDVFCGTDCQFSFFYFSEGKGDMSKKLTQQELFMEYLEDEQLKIDSLDFSPEGFQEAQKKLIERFELLESIAFESKARATRVSKKLRELSAASGTLHWDKESGGQKQSNLDGESWREKAAKHKKVLSKVEKTVEGFIKLDYTDEQILDMLPSNKFKPSEVREAIKSVRESAKD